MPKFMGRQLWYIGMEFVQFFHKGAKNAVGPVVGLVCISLGTVDDLFGQDHFLPKCYRFWNLTQTLPKCIINNRDCPLPELVFQAVTFHYMLACVSGKIGHKPLMDIDTAVFCINIGPSQPQQLAPGDSSFQHQHQGKPSGVFLSKGICDLILLLRIRTDGVEVAHTVELGLRIRDLILGLIPF